MRLRFVTVLSVGLLGVLCQPVGGQSGRAAPVRHVPLLPYKLVEWPTLPTSAAGAPAPWNFIQVSAAAVAAKRPHRGVASRRAPDHGIRERRGICALAG